MRRIPSVINSYFYLDRKKGKYLTTFGITRAIQYKDVFVSLFNDVVPLEESLKIKSVIDFRELERGVNATCNSICDQNISCSIISPISLQNEVEKYLKISNSYSLFIVHDIQQWLHFSHSVEYIKDYMIEVKAYPSKDSDGKVFLIDSTFFELTYCRKAISDDIDSIDAHFATNAEKWMLLMNVNLVDERQMSKIEVLNKSLKLRTKSLNASADEEDKPNHLEQRELIAMRKACCVILDSVNHINTIRTSLINKYSEESDLFLQHFIEGFFKGFMEVAYSYYRRTGRNDEDLCTDIETSKLDNDLDFKDASSADNGDVSNGKSINNDNNIQQTSSKRRRLE